MAIDPLVPLTIPAGLGGARALLQGVGANLPRGLSWFGNDSRIPVDVGADHTPDFSAETRRVLRLDAANRVTSCRNPRRTFDYAFSPTCNSATLKVTLHPPMPQYPSGFFARYCW